MSSVNDDLQDLFRAREITNPDERNELLSRVLSKLVTNHLRRPLSESVQHAPDQVGRVLMIIKHLASRQAGAFAYGEPSSVGPTILGLIEHLPHPCDERQSAVLAALSDVLQLLRVGSARALACVGQDAIEMLRALSRIAHDDARAADSICGFDAFAKICTASQATAAPAAVTLRIDSAERLRWARLGLLRLTAGLFASYPHFLGDGGLHLWRAALTHLVPPQPALAGAMASAAATSTPAPPLEPAVDAVRALLKRFDAPAPVRSGLMHRLLGLLTSHLPPYRAVAAALRPGSDSPTILLPAFRSHELDEAIGECLVLLVRAGAPPLDCLSLLERAVPPALVSSTSPALHAALCALIRALPVDAIDAQLRPVESLLVHARHRAVLLPCFEHALALRPPAATELPAEDYEMLDTGATIHDSARADAGAPAAEGGDADGSADGPRLTKRMRVCAPTLRQRLFHLAMGLVLEMGPAAGAEPARESLDVSALGVLGDITRLFLPPAESSWQAECWPASDVRIEWAIPLLDKLHIWLDTVLRLAAQQPACAGCGWRPGVAGTETSLMATALEVCHGLLSIDLKKAWKHAEFDSEELLYTVTDLACLPWVLPEEASVGGAGRREDLSSQDDAGRTMRALDEQRQFSPELRAAALRVLALWPSEIGSRLGGRNAALIAAIDGCVQALEVGASADVVSSELSVCAAALHELPAHVMMASDIDGTTPACAVSEWLPRFRALAAVCPPHLSDGLADCVGCFGCIESGQATSGGWPQHAVHCCVCVGGGGGGGEEEDAAGGVLNAAGAGGTRLFSLLPQLWDLYNDLPADESEARGALVRSMVKLARHAKPLELARASESLVPLLSLLGEEDGATRAVGEACLPPLLSHAPFVRAVTSFSEHEPLSPRALIDAMILPMADVMRASSETAVQRTMLRVLGALGREPLYASEACRAAIILILSEFLSVGSQPSAEHSLALQLIEAIANAQPSHPWVAHAGATTVGTGHSEAAAGGAAAGAPAISSSAASAPRTIAGLCRSLTPHLAPHWIWWLVRNPPLISAVARSLYDTDEVTLLQLLAPRAVPRIVLVGALDMRVDGLDDSMHDGADDGGGGGGQPGSAAAARLSVEDVDDYTEFASALLKTLASRLETTVKALLVEHMHLILSEVFTQVAGDPSPDGGEMAMAMPNALSFMYSHGIRRDAFPISGMIKMCARELFQEMVTRLGMAHGRTETTSVLMALNLLLPCGLHVEHLADAQSTSAMLTAGGGTAAFLSSLDVTGRNQQLANYIDANAMMLLDFLRVRIASRSASAEDKAIALHALHQLLKVLEADGSVPQWWWGEMVATLTHSLKQPALQAQALAVIRTFVSLLQEEQLARGLQQLVLMLLPCLPTYPKAVVRILEALVIHPPDEPPSEALASALGEITFLPNNKHLARVLDALARFIPQDEHLRSTLARCSKGVAHESREVRAMAAQQLLQTLRRAELQAESALADGDAARVRSASQSRSDPELQALLTSAYAGDVALVSELLHRLLLCVHESHNAAEPSSAARDELARTAECALQCLGQIGAHDPAKIGRAPQWLGEGKFGSGVMIDALATDALIAERLLEGPLLRMMRSAAEGHVPAAGYATMVLLQQVCGCREDTQRLAPMRREVDVALSRGMMPPESWNRLSLQEQNAATLWSRLADSTRRAITPYLTLKAEQTEAPKTVESPIYSTTPFYSDWIIRWCRQLLAATSNLRAALDGTPRRLLTEDQERRADLLVAMYACVRFDASLALSLLPLVITFLLQASPVSLKQLGLVDGHSLVAAPNGAPPAAAASTSGASQSGHGHGVLSRPALITGLVTEIDAVLLRTRDTQPRAGQSGHDQRAPGGGSSGSSADAEHILCCQALFEVVDTLNRWMQTHRQRNEQGALDAIRAVISRVSPMMLARAALNAGAHCRALRYLEHLGDSSPSSRPMPCHFHGPGLVPREAPTGEAAALMHSAYLQTDEPDGLLALARMRAQGGLAEERTLVEEALEHETHGRFSAALNCYQIALQAPPRANNGGAAGTVVDAVPHDAARAAAPVAENRNPQQADPHLGRGPAVAPVAAALEPTPNKLQKHLGLCRSLRNLGHFVTMRDAAGAAFQNAQTGLERSQLLPCVVQAAWRLGQWDDVRSLVATCAESDDRNAVGSSVHRLAAAFDGSVAPAAHSALCDPSLMTSDDRYETELARALLSLHEGHAGALAEHAAAARRALIPPIAAAGMDSYARTYGSLVKLQVVQELQAAGPLLLAVRGQQRGVKASDAVDQLEALVHHWRDRLSFVADTPPVVEPILAMRTAILRIAEHAACQRPANESCGGDSVGAQLRQLTASGLSQVWLRHAKSARAADHLESATNALAQASMYDGYSALLFTAKMAWEAGRPHEAILRLQQQRKSLMAVRAGGGSSGVQPAWTAMDATTSNTLLARTLVRLARYTEEQVGDAEHDEIRRMHQEAAKCCPQWEKVHYHHGRFHDGVLVRGLAGAKRKEVARQGRAAGARSAFEKATVKTSERHGKMLGEFAKHLPEVVRNYAQALKRGMRHAALAVSRLLALWLEFSDLQCEAYGRDGTVGANKLHRLAEQEERVHQLIERDIKEIAPFQWLPEVALLVSRTTIANGRAQPVVHSLLSMMLATYPAQLSWSILPAALSSVAERKNCADKIAAQARRQLIGQQKAQHAGHGQPAQDVLTQGRNLIQQLKRVCNDNSMGKRETSLRMSAKWASLYRMTDLSLVIPTHANLTAAPPEDGGAMRDFEPFSESAVLIDGWLDDVVVMGSLQRPKKIGLRGADGGTYYFLAKPKDDLRKDARMMELMTAANRMLHKSTNCRRRKLAARCYAVVPLDQECGLIEWVPNMEQVRTLITRYWRTYKHVFDQSNVKQRHQAASAHPSDKRGALALLIKQLMGEMPPVLHHWLTDTFPSPAAWFEARLAFTRSCAVMSMIGYSVGLGDRHLENILIDTTTGSLMHVDFACLFDHGLNLETPERVPFRLTQNLIHTFGVCGADGVFRRVCELTLGQLRANKLSVLTILSTLRHDPLVEWSKRNNHEDQAGMKESDEAEKEIEKIDLKLQGINQMRSPTPQSVDGQVAKLINDATDVNNLCQMYVWWMPWC